ncbi:MAG: TerC family protein, partial [Planctomycetota bacterium]
SHIPTLLASGVELAADAGWGQIAAALAALIAIEVVLGVDNLVFIAIATTKLPEHQQAKARTIGLILAAVSRVGLLFVISIILSLSEPIFELAGRAISIKDLVLIAGGLFLLYKATHEVHGMLELQRAHGRPEPQGKASFGAVLAQIAVLDMVFSIDSVITAVGMADRIWVMVVAVLVAVAVMIAFAGPVTRFVQRHPAFKVLALAFLMLIGVALVADGLGQHIPRGYIYAAMAFSGFVEVLQLKTIKKKRGKAEQPAGNAG